VTLDIPSNNIYSLMEFQNNEIVLLGGFSFQSDQVIYNQKIWYLNLESKIWVD